MERRAAVPGRTLLAAALVALAATGAARGGDGLTQAALAGPAKVLSGDTLEIAGARLRLAGVHAPRLDQRCRAEGIEWGCGLVARARLSRRIGDRRLRCEAARADGPGPVPARCRIADRDGRDLGEWLIASGWALADPDGGEAASLAETRARRAGAGLWHGGFTPDPAWRNRAALPYRDGDAAALECDTCAARHRRLDPAAARAEEARADD